MKDHFIKKLVLSNTIGFRITRHLLFWIIILFYFSGFLRPNSNFYDLLKYNLHFLPIDIVSTYILIYFIYPMFLKGKSSIFKGAGYLVLLVLIHYFISHFIEIGSEGIISSEEYPLVTKILMSSRIMIIIFFTASFIKTIKYWYKTEINYRELERKNTENKMILLSSQLHPHFLYNTLNNLYTLSIQKSDKLPEMMLGLSTVMRYITDNQKTQVSLKKEIEIISSYIKIEKLRYDESLSVAFDINVPEQELDRINIPPLLIFTFVENAFKHGVSNSVINPWITVLIDIDDDTLRILVENSVDDYFTKEPKREGVGLKNVQKRLQLYYPKRTKFVKNKFNDRFSIDLEIKLQNHEDKMFNR